MILTVIVMISKERLKEFLDYNHDTGIFTWIKLPFYVRRVHVGDVAGSNHGNGYLHVKIEGIQYFAHRLAWLFVYREMPSKHIDHIDHDKKNNRISNLRDVSVSENQQNRIKCEVGSTSGFLGVSFDKSMRKYEAHIGLNGKKKHIGYFMLAEEAYEAYLTVKREIHPGCTI